MENSVKGNTYDSPEWIRTPLLAWAVLSDILIKIPYRFQSQDKMFLSKWLGMFAKQMLIAKCVTLDSINRFVHYLFVWPDSSFVFSLSTFVYDENNTITELSVVAR